MSRIRTIKPELWTSEQVSSCSLQARLLFIGMWNFCDDNGVHHASCKRLKMEVFPGDNFTEKNISDWIKELIQNRLVMEYEKEGKSYWIVTGWKKHQRIERPTYRYPLPKTELENIDDHSVSVQIVCPDTSYKTQQVPQDLSPLEWNGKEGKGENINRSKVEPLPVDIDESNTDASTQLFEYWKSIMIHPRAKFDRKRKQAITKALKLGYSIADLKQAIDGCKNTPYNMGKNDTGQVYDDVSLILRDAAHIERFIRNADNYQSEQCNSTATDLMAGVL